jgi:excisionase family DNA binding protein
MLLDADRDGWPKHSDLPPIGSAALGCSCFRKEIAMTVSQTKQFISIAAAAEHLDVSLKTIRRRIAAGDLKAYRLGGSRVLRVNLNELDDLMRPIPTVRPTDNGGRVA